MQPDSPGCGPVSQSPYYTPPDHDTMAFSENTQNIKTHPVAAPIGHSNKAVTGDRESGAHEDKRQLNVAATKHHPLKKNIPLAQKSVVKSYKPALLDGTENSSGAESLPSETEAPPDAGTVKIVMRLQSTGPGHYSSELSSPGCESASVKVTRRPTSNLVKHSLPSIPSFMHEYSNSAKARPNNIGDNEEQKRPQIDNSIDLHNQQPGAGKHFECAVCCKSFAYHDNFLRHRSTAHRGDELEKAIKLGGQRRPISNEDRERSNGVRQDHEQKLTKPHKRYSRIRAKHRCKYCGRRFQSGSKKDLHMVHHENNELHYGCRENFCNQMFETWFEFYQHSYHYHKIKVYSADANLYRINPDWTKVEHSTERRGNPKSATPVGSGYRKQTRGLGFLPSGNNETLRHNFNASFNLPDEVLNFDLAKNKDNRMNELGVNSKEAQKGGDDDETLKLDGTNGTEDLDDEGENDVQSGEAKTGTGETYRKLNSSEDFRKQLKIFRRAAHLPPPVSFSGINGHIMHVQAKKIGAPEFPTPTESIEHLDLDATEDFDEDDDLIFDGEVFENGSTHSERLHSTPKRARLDPKGFQACAPTDKRSKSRKQIADFGTDSEAKVTEGPATATSSTILATPISSSSNRSTSRLKKNAPESSVSPGSISPSILISKETAHRNQSSVMCESVPTKRQRVHSVPTSRCLKLPEIGNTDEQCCLLALVDSFKNLGDQGRLVAKQEILRILGNIVYEMSIPSMLVSNMGTMARLQEGTQLNQQEGKGQEDAENFCNKEVFPLIRKIDGPRRKLAVLKIQHALYSIQVEYSTQMRNS